MHITNEANEALKTRFQQAQKDGAIPKVWEFKMSKRLTDEETNEHEFFAVDPKGHKIEAIGTVTGVVTICG